MYNDEKDFENLTLADLKDELIDDTDLADSNEIPLMRDLPDEDEEVEPYEEEEEEEESDESDQEEDEEEQQEDFDEDF